MIKRENVADKEIAFEKSSQVLFCPKLCFFKSAITPGNTASAIFFCLTRNNFSTTDSQFFPTT